MLPLQDLQIVDLTRLLPGPFATMLLSDLGARVVKVEGPPPGDYLRWLPPHVHEVNAAFSTLNRNKRSVVVRLDSPAGAEVVRRLAARSHVLVESFRPGVMARFGLAYESLAEANPALVYCSLSGFGSTGSYARRAGHDLDFLALSGLGSALVDREGTPVQPLVQLGDMAGGMSAALAILAAVHEARSTGCGRHVDVSLTDACQAFTMVRAAESLAAGAVPQPGRDVLTGGNPAYRYHRCRDGRWLAVGSLEPKFRERLLEITGCEDSGGEWSAADSEDSLHHRLEEAFLSRDRDEWVALFEGADACVEPVLEQHEVADHPLARERGLVRQAWVPGGTVPQPASPLHPTFAPGQQELGQAAPPPGVHTRQVLEELGYSPAEVEALEAAGDAVAAPAPVVEAWTEGWEVGGKS